MALIKVNNLTFYYDGSYDNIFEDVSFQIDTNWKLGFVGRNGRGKTTFLNLLQGKMEYTGSITGSNKFDYFPFVIEDKSKNGIDIIEEIYPDYEFWMVCRELSLLDMEADILYRPFNTLSNGEQTKVMLAVLFSRENNFLLIDEPTNHLDMEAREAVKEYLNGKKGFILVSHDRRFLDGCVDHILAINKSNIEVCQGGFSTWWENKQRQDEYEMAENEKLKKDINRLNEAARRTGQWADKAEASKIGMSQQEKKQKAMGGRAYIGEKSRRMQAQRKNIEKRRESAIDDKKGLLKNIENAEQLKIIPLIHHKNLLINMENISLTYDDGILGKRTIFENMNLKVSNGDRIVLQGKNGCGKSSIIKKILGQNIPINGNIELATGLEISYISQDTSFLEGTLKDYAKENNIEDTLFMTLLRKLDFSREQFDKNMEEFSEGQKKKVLIAGSLCKQAHLYIWDEPLNFIDLFSRMQIEELILKYNPTMLLVEHDRTFVESIATKVVVF